MNNETPNPNFSFTLGADFSKLLASRAGAYKTERK
jgi:hypothetical protein